MTDYCLFCDRENTKEHEVFAENDLFYVRFYNNPVNKGHSLIIPKRHIISFFELTEDEVTAMYELLKEAKAIIDKDFKPDGYNIGVNDGEAAGRSIHHLHIHLIPRYIGDVENPRGGVRYVIPMKGNY